MFESILYAIWVLKSWVFHGLPMRLGPSYLNKLIKALALPDQSNLHAHGLKPCLGTQDANHVPEEVSKVHVTEVGPVPFVFGMAYKFAQLFLQDGPVIPAHEHHDPMSDVKVMQNMFLRFFKPDESNPNITSKFCMREVDHAPLPAPECPSSMGEARFNL